MISTTPISLFHETSVEFCIILVGVTAICSGAVYYLRHVRMDRPPIGTFNGRDIVILLAFVIALPFLYGYLPYWLITCLLALTFSSALYLGYGQVIGRTRVWIAIGLLIGVNIYTSHHLLGTTYGWQAWWLEDGLLVGLAAVSVANLYVQGGMKLKYVAWISLVLAVYDVVFATILPLTDKLVSGYLSHPLDPLLGFRFGIDNYGVGLGDLLVYSLFVVACYKAYGKAGLRIGFGMVGFFGAFMTAAVPWVINVLDVELDLLVPAQAVFGPAAFICYLWMRRRYGPERTMAQFIASPDNAAGRAAAREPVLVPEPASA
jgi:hypothetical protein